MYYLQEKQDKEILGERVKILNSKSNIIKYIFIIIIAILIIVTSISFYKEKKAEQNKEALDHTSNFTNIQRDIRLSITEFDNINPLLSENRNVQEISKVIFEPLVTFDSTYKMQYCLAREIAKTSDTTYLIQLREDVKFHDGTTFDSNDVKFTIDTILGKGISIYRENLKFVSGLNLIDDYTLTLSLSQPVDFFEYNLTFPIMSSEFYNGEDFVTSAKNNAPVGTGMFKIDLAEEKNIRLEKNDDYWNIKNRDAMIEKIYINKYGSIGEAYTAFKNGELDIMNIKIQNIEEYIGSLGYKKIQYKGRDYTFLSFNTMHGDINTNPRVREAISFAIDKNFIIANVLGGAYGAANYPTDFGSWSFSGSSDQKYNLDVARQLLEADGWNLKNGNWQKNINGRNTNLFINLTVNRDNGTIVNVANNIRDQLGNFGIVVNIKALAGNKYNEAINNRAYEAAIITIRNSYSPNVNTFLGEGNLANYNNDEVKSILNEIKNSKDENFLNEKFNRLYQIYETEAPFIGLYRNINCVVCHQSLVGNITPNAYNIYHNIEKWYRQ